MKNIVKRSLAALGFLCLVTLLFAVMFPKEKASANIYEQKTSAKRAGKVVKEDAVEGDSIVSVVENENLRITLKTDKKEYHAGDPVSLKTEIEYIGKKDGIELTTCNPSVAYRIDGSNGVKLYSFADWFPKTPGKFELKKGEKFEEDFQMGEYGSFALTGSYDIIGGEKIRYNNEDPITVFYLPKGTYTFTVMLTDQLAKKKPATFYAELHINIDVEGNVFADGSNLYRTLGDNEAVLIGTKADDKVSDDPWLEQGVAFTVPETAKYNGKKYTVTVIGDEGIRYSGWVDDYEYGYIDAGVFSRLNFTTVKIPSTVKVISRSAFRNTQYNKIEINAGDLIVGEKAFSINENYRDETLSLEIKGGNVKIEKEAFLSGRFTKINIHDCKSLEIGELAFACEYNLKEVKLPENTLSIGNRAFYDSAERKDKVTLTIPKGTVKIEGPVANKMLVKVAKGNTSFVTRYGLLLTADGSTVIGISDFRYREIAMPEGITSIMPYAFSGTLITKLTIPDTVTVIPEGMAYITTLKSVSLGKYTKEIGNSAFCDTALKKISLPNGLESIGESAFASTRLKKVTIPKTVTVLGNRAFANNNITVTFKKNNKKYTQKGDVLLEKGTNTAVGFVYSNIGDAEFEKLDLEFVLRGYIYTLNIPESVKEIDISSFSSKLMGEYYTGRNLVYEAAEIIFKTKEPPKFVDERNSDKEFCIMIFIPEDGDMDAYKAALEEVGLKEYENYRITNQPYDEW